MHTSNHTLGRSRLSGTTSTTASISSGDGSNGTVGKMSQQLNGAPQNHHQVSLDANVLVVEEANHPIGSGSGASRGGESSSLGSSSSSGYDQGNTNKAGQAQAGQGLQYQRRDTASALFPERSKYLEEYTRNVRTPRAQSARMSSGHSQGQGQGSHVAVTSVQKTTEDSNHSNASQGGGGGSGSGGSGLMSSDNHGLDVFDCLPLSAWSDDTLIGLPTSYVLYDKFQKLSTIQHEHQRASSAKPSESKRRHTGANRLVSSSKGPRRTNMLGNGSRASTPTKQHRGEFSSSAQKHRMLSRDRDQRAFTNQLNYHNHQSHQHNRHASYEQEGEEENHSLSAYGNGLGGSSTSSSISEWPNSLRIVVPMKLKTKQRPNSNPNLHSYQSTGRERDRNNYFGYHSKPNSAASAGSAGISSGSHNGPSIPSALRVQQQKNREEKQREKERSAALAKAKLLSNYRNRHHQKVHENEEPLVISKASQISNQKQSWRK